MLISPSDFYYHGYGSGCSPCKPTRCVKAPPPCPKPCEDVFTEASKAPFNKYFNCLKEQEVRELLQWAERYRLYIHDSQSSTLSVILAALHFLRLGYFQEMQESSYLSIMGNSQISRKSKYNYGDGWNSTIFGAQYLDLKNHTRRFAMGTSY